MSTENQTPPAIKSIGAAIAGSALVLILPSLHWGFFGWLQLLFPLVAFHCFGKFGSYAGKRIIAIALAIAAAWHAVAGGLDLMLFAAGQIIVGLVLHRSVSHGDSPALSGLKGSVTMAACWLLLLLIASIGEETSAYLQLRNTLDSGINEALQYYRQNSEVTAETLLLLETTLSQMKVVIPKILPAILASMILFSTWACMVLGNVLLRTGEGTSPWPSFRFWQLPEKLIWVVIGMAVLAIIPVDMPRFAGINALILLSLIYCFQGLAITVFFLNKWGVPLFLRSFIYAMIIVQSFGTFVLLILGIVDIWLDFRKLKTRGPDVSA